MKFIKIFLASSIVEFENERRQLGDFLRSLNDSYVRRGIYLELVLCEDLDNALAMERKQQEYNQQIRDSQYFYIIFGRRAGEYTIEEFDVALEQFRQKGAPRIYTYFLDLPADQPPEQSLLDFMDRLDKQLGHYYSTFSHIDAIKLNLLLELMRDPAVGGQVSFEDGRAMLDAKPVLALENLPLYSKNETVQGLVSRQEALNAEFARLAVEYGRAPADAALLARMMKLGEERGRVADALHRLESDMLGLYSQAAEKRQAGKALNWRERKAIDCVDRGDYEGAKTILRDAQWEKELEQAEARIEAARQPVREYISGKRALISTLLASGQSRETIDEAGALYERCCALARQHGMEQEVLFAYTRFLLEQRQYLKAAELAEECARLPGLAPARQAEAAWLVGQACFWNQNYTGAEASMRAAYKAYRALAAGEPERYEKELARVCIRLGLTLQMVSRMKEAMVFSAEGLAIQRRLAEKDPQNQESALAYACNDHALLLWKNNDLAGAERFLREALGIYRRLMTGKPSGRNDVARACLNLASILRENGQLAEAEMLGRESLAIRRELAAQNPAAFQAELALCCNNHANTLFRMDRLEEAEALYREALSLRRPLAGANPGAYRQDLAMSCSNLARFFVQTGRLDEAGPLYRESLALRRELAATGSPAYEEDLAKGCVDMASLLNRTGRLEEARGLLQEALAVYRRLTEASPEAYEPALAQAAFFMGRLLKEMNRPQEAEPYSREALELRQRLAEAHPKAFRPVLVDALIQYAALLPEIGRAEEGEQTLLRALEVSRLLAEEDPEQYRPYPAAVWLSLGIFWRQDKPEKAAGALQNALALYEVLAEKAPALYLKEKARVLFELGRLAGQADPAKAEGYYEAAWPVYARLAEMYPDAWYPYLSGLAYNLYLVKKRLEKWDEAERYCREALKVDRQIAACNPALYWYYPAESGEELARLLLGRTGPTAEVRALFEEALGICKAHGGREEAVQRIEGALRENFGA